MRTYVETYEYDEVGNFAALSHDAKNAPWVRSYQYLESSLLEPDKQSNRLTATGAGTDPTMNESFLYDSHGCVTAINAMHLRWDYLDQLRQVDLEDGRTAFYVYDSTGQRIRKVIESSDGVRRSERLYLGALERYRQFSGDEDGHVEFERESIHVMDDRQADRVG